ncbi:zona pellucida sperm-binding protein 3-like isoform X2 [Syngnathus scovelli]|uniref:zona pellucida sperm-binding protein 3-like isoform X2 n=1 Tax=Syngnathus scovelli TaxID=161590 RepID=UPI00210F5C3D|nr:zona pellucida sperm-binding protein 3-like isoform X2 [Syngnathus scovelli]
MSTNTNKALLGLALSLAVALLASPQDLKLRSKVQQAAAGQAFPQERPLSWKPPQAPAEEEPRFPPHFELKPPEVPDAVLVVCQENSIRVEAKRFPLGTVGNADVTLGGCPATGEDSRNQVLIFESELHGCGSQLLMSEDALVYIFTLQYTASPLGDTPIVRTGDVTVGIRCQYRRKHDVSSGFLRPTWSPLSDSKVPEESLYFSFRLMTDDWQTGRPSSQFLLGDMMKFEVWVKQFQHAPLRVTVDSCVATVVRNVDTVPRYAFLANNGCLFDSQVTGSSSRFLPRWRDDRLQFQVEAFKFQQDDSGTIYISCNLKAMAATAAVDSANKACSFTNGWTEASGVHQACSCCDTDCGTRSWRRATGNGAKWEEEVAVGPITVKKRPVK